MSAEKTTSRAQGQSRSNIRLGLILASIALAAFVGVMLRYSVFR